MKIHREGTNILILLFLMLVAFNVPVWLFMPPYILPGIITALCVLVYVFVFNFFRSPTRHFRGDRDRVVVSSVDGKVVAVEEVEEPEFIGGRAIQLSVFMSPMNVHVNWFPVEGTVVYRRHHKGRFLSAYLPKSSTENERTTLGIETREGYKIVVRQVAGAMARRIVTYAKRGDSSQIDHHLGFIKFGSRVDLYLPLGSEICVKIGDRTIGDVTTVARLPKKS